jgi:hypothetical protein
MNIPIEPVDQYACKSRQNQKQENTPQIQAFTSVVVLLVINEDDRLEEKKNAGTNSDKHFAKLPSQARKEEFI